MKTKFKKYDGWQPYNRYDFLAHCLTLYPDNTPHMKMLLNDINVMFTFRHPDVFEHGFTTKQIMNFDNNEDLHRAATTRTMKTSARIDFGDSLVPTNNSVLPLDEKTIIEVVDDLYANIRHDKQWTNDDGFAYIPYTIAISGGIVVDPNTFNSIMSFYTSYAIIPLFTY